MRIGEALRAFRDAYARKSSAAPSEKAPRVTTAESAAAESSWSAFQGNPDQLIAKKGMGVIDEMREDDALGAFTGLKKSAVLASPWKIVPASDEPKDVEVAEFVEWCLGNIPGSLREKLRDILTALEYGYSITNRPFRVIDFGPFKGKVGLLDLKTKEPHNFRFEMDEFRNITMLLHTTPHGREEKLAPEDFVVYTYRKEFANPYGRSDYGRCYRAWNLKRHVYKFWGIYLERSGGGFMHISFDPNIRDAEAHTVAKNFVTDVQSRTGLILPNYYTVNPHETSGRGHEIFKDTIQEQNIYMGRALFVPELIMSTSASGGGAYALGKEQANTFLWFVDDIRDDLSETVVDEQIIKPLVDVNYSGVDAYPYFTFEPLSDEAKYLYLSQILAAVEKGVLTVDLGIENRVRELLELEEKEEEDEPEEKEPITEPVGDDVPTPDDAAILPAEEDDETGSHALEIGGIKLARALTSFEAKIDFEQIVSVQEILEKQITDIWADLFRVARDDLVAAIVKRRIVADEKEGEVEKLTLSRREDMRKSFARFMLSVFYSGALEAQREMKRTRTGSHEMAVDRFQVPPGDIPLDEVEEYFRSKGLVMTPAMKQAAREVKKRAYFITGIETEKILSKAKIITMNGLSRVDVAWTESELLKLFDGYIQTGAITDKTLGEMWRIGTIVRMQFNTAFNEGRRRKFEDPDVEDFIEAYSWSAVLDDATTDYCRAMDGKVYRKSDIDREGWPPAHFNCRSIVVPVTQGEKYELSELPTTRGKRADGFEMCAHVAHGG